MKSFNDQLTIIHCWHIATQEQKIRLTTFNIETLLQQTSKARGKVGLDRLRKALSLLEPKLEKLLKHFHVSLLFLYCRFHFTATDFSLTSCGNGPKWTKTMQTQTRRVRLQIFLRGIQICHMKADVLEIPKMWWFFILDFFKPKLLLPKVGSNLKNFFFELRC